MYKPTKLVVFLCVVLGLLYGMLFATRQVSFSDLLSLGLITAVGTIAIDYLLWLTYNDRPR